MSRIRAASGMFAIALLTLWAGAAAAETQPRPTGLEAQLLELQRRTDRLDSLLQRASPPTAGVSAARVTRSVIARFLPYIREDLDHGEVRRASAEIDALQGMLDRLERGGSDPGQSAAVRIGFTGADPGQRGLAVRGSAVVSTRIGAARPVFLAGYVGFRRLRDDLETLPNVGANLIQIEVGPSALLPRAGVIDHRPIDDLVHILDRAARVGVAVDLLLSPHYLPPWVLAEAPELKKRRRGFVEYCIHHPRGRELLTAYVRALLAPIKDHPALFSVCLSNEPENFEEPCPYATHAWHTWLAERHGGVESYNQAHSTGFTKLEDVPLPDPHFPPPADRAAWMDFVRFNQEQFAAWHKLLADAAHDVAPRLPVHVKAGASRLLGRPADEAVGLDPMLLSELSDVNGHDAMNTYWFSGGEFANAWLESSMTLELQRSINSAPVFNSENHLINDREERYVPPSHIRAMLWQSAVHGQSATALWVWDRSFDRKSDFWGSVLERPEAIEAVGLTNLDLNRAAPELQLFRNVTPQVSILHSVSGQVWEPQARERLDATYAALSFSGLKIGMVTERQLELGKEITTPVLFIPGNVHLSSAALRTLASYKGRLVFIGQSELLSRDDHDRTAQVKLTGEVLANGRGNLWRAVWEELATALPRWGLTPSLLVRHPGGSPVWGVEWLTAAAPKPARSLVVNLCNHRNDAVTIQLVRDGAVVSARDVLTGRRLPNEIILAPLQPRLLRVDRAGRWPVRWELPAMYRSP